LASEGLLVANADAGTRRRIRLLSGAKRTSCPHVRLVVNLLPKVTAPLEIILVDVEVVGVRNAAQQGRGQGTLRARGAELK
jgi:hypothetical protein